MKTSTAILIGVGVFVGIPIVLVGVVAYAAKRMFENALRDPSMLPMSGTANNYRWSITRTEPMGLWTWLVVTTAGVEVASGAAGNLDEAKRSVLNIISNQEQPS